MAIEVSRSPRGQQAILTSRTGRPIACACLFYAVIQACGQQARTAPADNRMLSVYTPINEAACRKASDPDDPNQTSYLLCPGVGGYTVQVHQVESGQSSVTVVTPTKLSFPLHYQNVVTRAMAGVDDRAEWRVRSQGGRQTPIALIVRVLAHESSTDPEKVTTEYLAIAKLTAARACVTNTIRVGAKSTTELHALEDAAPAKACVANLPASIQ